MKKLAVLGSSGGNLYTQGGNDPQGMMREIFVWREDRWSETLRHMGDALGRFLYLLDAAMDLDEDAHPVNTIDNGAERIAQAEKFSAASFEVPRAITDSMEPITAYGIQQDSRYWRDMDVSGGAVVIGAGLSQKCRIEPGQIIHLTDKYTNKTYDLTVSNVWGSSANMNVYLVLKDDGSYELIADGSSLIPAFREAAYKYLETMCEENGKSIDDLQELTGMDAETMLDALIADMDLEEMSDTFEGSYTQRDGALVLDPGQNETEGSYDGMLLTMEIEEEKLIFTRSSFLGTWNGYLDVTEIFTEGDEELEGYLENVKIGVTLQLNADGSYTVSLNPRPMLTSLHSGLRAYLEDGAKEQNVTLEELEASLGMSLDEYIDEFLSELGADQLAQEESGSYTVKNGSIRFPEDASAFVSGVWFGTTMVVTMEDVGDAVLTRR